MIGLIKKDLLIIKGNFKLLGLIIIIFVLMMSINGDNNLSFIAAFLNLTIMMNTFSYEQYNNTDAYITTFPNGKASEVKAKYISTMITLFITVTLTLLLSLLTGYIKNNINLKELLPIYLGSITAITIIESILYPIIFKFGIEKSRIGLFIGVFSISGLIALLYKTGFKFKIPKYFILFLDKYYLIIIPIVLIIIIGISYIISKKIYLKKEF